jgi:2-dehydropantoate 2-reductase
MNGRIALKRRWIVLLAAVVMIVGATGRQDPAGARDVAARLTRAGIATELSPRLPASLWLKVINNLATNPLSVVTGATLKEIFSDPNLARITRHVLDEARAVAEAYEVTIEITPDALMAHGASLGDVRTSMLQDFDCGRPLELPTIGDAVVALGAHKGIPMPHTQNILDLARYKAETRNTGAHFTGDLR